MVLAAMANPPEHDFAPSWLKIPSDQQKRGQKLGASDQWSAGNKSGHQQQHEDGGSKSRHRHYSSSDSSSSSSHPSGGYGRSPSSSSTLAGPPQGGYGYRGREPDRRHYPRPGSGSRHHSVDDLNGYHDYGGWNLPQYNGFYSNYPRRGSSSAGLRDGPQHYGNSRYGDIFHQGGRGYFNNSGGRGGSAGRQRYHSGSRAGYNDRDNQPDGSSSSHGGDDGHGDVSGKKKEGGDDSKNSALSSNDFPSLVGDNSKSSVKDAAAKSTNTPAGVWDKPPGTAKVQISGRKVQLIKKSIHNDLPPRDSGMASSIKSSGKTSSSGNAEGSKVGGHSGSGGRVNRPASSVSTVVSSSSSVGGYKSSTSASQKASLDVKVTESPATTPHLSPKSASKDSNLHSPKFTPNPPKSTTNPPKPPSDVSPSKPPTISAQSDKSYEKKASPPTAGAANKTAAKVAVGSSLPDSGVTSAKNGGAIKSTAESGRTLTKRDVSKAGPSKHAPQGNSNGSKSSSAGRESSGKPVLVATATTPKPVAKQLGGKESPTKPVLVQAITTVATSSKSTIKPMSVKNTNGKPVLKESPIRPVPVQIKAAKFSGKDSAIRPFPVRTSNQKQGSRDRSVRPGPVQIKSSRLVGVVAKDTPSVRPVPVHIMTRKPTAAKDNPSDSVTMATRSVPSNSKEKQTPTAVTHFNTTSTLAKEPSTNPTTTPPMDIRSSRLGLINNANNSDCTKDALKSLQNGGDNWTVNGPLRIEDAEKMNGPQHSTLTEINTGSSERTQHLTSNGLDNDLQSGKNNLELSSSLEAEKRLLQEMGWHEHSDNEEGYAPITEDEMKEFQRRSQQLKRNGFARSLPAAFLSSSLPNTPMTSIDLDDALSSCSSDSSDDDL